MTSRLSMFDGNDLSKTFLDNGDDHMDEKTFRNVLVINGNFLIQKL
jgi:hypothetical protein